MQHFQIPKEIICVKGPDGFLTEADLPASRAIRWVPRRKAKVVAAVIGGLINLEEACRRYNLTLEEFSGWQEAYRRLGIRGLRTTKAKRALVQRERRSD